jgi:hypothetical protein
MRISPRTIYDTYLRGPVAVIRLFEQTFGTNALSGPPTPDQQQQVIDSLVAQLDHLQAQLDCEPAASSALRSEN